MSILRTSLRSSSGVQVISAVDGGCFSTERVSWLEVSVMATGDGGGMEMESVDLGKKSNWVKEGSGSCSFGWPILVGYLYRNEIPGDDLLL